MLPHRRVQPHDRRAGVASHTRTEMVLDAIEMARWPRGHHHADLRSHSDAESQFTPIRYGE